MSDKVKSLQARLYSIATEKGQPFQLILNQFGSEQFLERLTLSDYAMKFVFKGGRLLAYMVETERKTKDLDFSIKEISNRVKELLVIVEKILKIKIDDEITWKDPEGEMIDHWAMDYPGARIKCPFVLGKMKGIVRMDLAMGDRVNAQWIPLPKLSYRGSPLAGEMFKIYAYPAESVFSEKLHAVVTRGTENTRMKDYYDLHILCQTDIMDLGKLKEALAGTFKKRETPLPTHIDWSGSGMEKIQSHWERYLRKERIEGVPKSIGLILRALNQKLRELF
jgi:predicted nucleotidyltransferase component of viral defense system